MCIQIVEQETDIFNAPKDAVLIFVNRSNRPNVDEIDVITGMTHDFIFLPLYADDNASLFTKQKLINTITKGLSEIISSPKTANRKLWLSTNAFNKYSISWGTVKECIENININNANNMTINAAIE